jgi:hypothetical protein
MMETSDRFSYSSHVDDARIIGRACDLLIHIALSKTKLMRYDLRLAEAMTLLTQIELMLNAQC